MNPNNILNFKNVLIVASKQDPAGMNIRKALLKLYAFESTDLKFEEEVVFKLRGQNTYLITISEKSIESDLVDERFFRASNIKPELVVFITKHESKTKISSLCIHSPGNFGEAMLGGKPRELCVAPACYLKTGLKFLNELNNSENLGFDVVEEVTHHGPFLKTPAFFIEIGSKIEEWENEKAGFIVAQALMKTLKQPEHCISAIGLGGPHTTPNFKKIVINTNIGLGHVVAKYNIPDLNKELIIQAINKTIPRPNLIILDWKGLGPRKQEIKAIVEEIAKEEKLKVLRTKDF